MSRLNIALVIGAILLVAGASDAQAAKIRVPLFDLIDALSAPIILSLDSGRRITAIDFDDQGNGNGNEPSIAPDDSRSLPDWKTHYVDKGDWSPKGTDESDTGNWQQTPQSQDTPQWTMQTVTNNSP